MLTMPDFEAAAAHPAPVVCDATLASPLRLRPLELGCDVALHSATKVLAGHDDLIAGVATVRDDALYDRLHLTRRLTGIVASADTAWLLERGLETLEVRLDRMEATARILVDRLAGHPAVTTVRYPGFGFLISFDVADGDAARRVETATTTIVNATSLGGTHTKLESRYRWEGERCPEGLLRLSVGLEDRRGTVGRPRAGARARPDRDMSEVVIVRSDHIYATLCAVRTIPATRFKAECLQLLDDVADSGEAIIVTKRGKPVARLLAARATGVARGQRDVSGRRRGVHRAALPRLRALLPVIVLDTHTWVWWRAHRAASRALPRAKSTEPTRSGSRR